MTETPKIDKFEIQPRRSVRPFAITQIVLFAIAWGVLVGLWIQFWKARPNEEIVAAFVGIGFAQVSLAAGWLALGPFRIVVRSVGAAIILSVSYLAAVACFLDIPPGRVELPIFIGLFVGYLGNFIALQLPFWLFRYWLGLSVVHLTELQPDDSNRRRQFTIRELLATTTIIAVVLALGRGVILSLAQLEVRRNSGPGLSRAITLFLMMAGFNLLLAWPAMGAILMPRGHVLTVPLAMIIAVVATYLEGPLFEKMFGGGGPNMLVFFEMLNGPQYLLLLLSLTITRWFGYVLVRTPR